MLLLLHCLNRVPKVVIQRTDTAESKAVQTKKMKFGLEDNFSKCSSLATCKSSFTSPSDSLTITMPACNRFCNSTQRASIEADCHRLSNGIPFLGNLLRGKVVSAWGTLII